MKIETLRSSASVLSAPAMAIGVVLLTLLPAGCAHPGEATTPRATSDDAAQIESMVRSGARECVAGNPATPLSHFSSDIVLTYPGVPDQSLDQLRSAYAELCSPTEGAVESTEPMFEEVRVNGDMAIVRVVWRTHLRSAPAGTFRYLRDMQVWERLPEGWRFTRGVHFPIRPDDPVAIGWHATANASD